MQIIEVKSSSHYKEFLNLVSQINEKSPLYVRPLNLHMKMMIGKLGTPQKHLFIAQKNGKTVARVGCKIHKHHDKTALHFGFFECLEGHKDAAVALITHIRKLYPNEILKGPTHFRLEDPYVGALVDGFEQDPYFLMPYNPPYYDEYLKAAGLSTAMDLFTYQAEAANGMPQSIYDNAAECDKKGFTVRTLNKNKLREEATHIANIFNDALSNNWGYEEFLDEQVDEMVTLFKVFIDPRVVFIVEKDGRAIGSLVMLPNYNPVIKSGNGRLTPKVIWNFMRTKNKHKSLRGYALGVLKEFHGQGIASLICREALKHCVAAGYETCEISWILASNGPMNELSKHLGGKQSKTYRIYEAPKISSPEHQKT